MKFLKVSFILSLGIFASQLRAEEQINPDVANGAKVACACARSGGIPGASGGCDRVPATAVGDASPGKTQH